MNKDQKNAIISNCGKFFSFEGKNVIDIIFKMSTLIEEPAAAQPQHSVQTSTNSFIQGIKVFLAGLEQYSFCSWHWRSNCS